MEAGGASGRWCDCLPWRHTTAENVADEKVSSHEAPSSASIEVRPSSDGRSLGSHLNWLNSLARCARPHAGALERDAWPRRCARWRRRRWWRWRRWRRRWWRRRWHNGSGVFGCSAADLSVATAAARSTPPAAPAMGRVVTSENLKCERVSLRFGWPGCGLALCVSFAVFDLYFQNSPLSRTVHVRLMIYPEHVGLKIGEGPAR